MDSASDHQAASTPPTSVSDHRSTHSTIKAADDMAEQQQNDITTRRSRRARTSVNYNLKSLLDATAPESSSQSRRHASGLSGRTLVERDDEEDDDDMQAADQLTQALSSPSTSPKGKSIAKQPTRRPSIKERAKNAATVLGKRTRDMVEAGKKKLGLIEEDKNQESLQKSKLLKELDMGTGGVLDELDLDAEFEPPPTKRLKVTKTPRHEMAQPVVAGPMQKTSDGKRVKKWQQHGLYAGQEVDADSSKPGSKKKLQKKRPVSATSETVAGDEDAPEKPKSRLGFNLPMFTYLDEEMTRSMRIPYDVYAPSHKKAEGEKPKDWHKLNRNRLVGDAKELWAMEEKLPTSACVCRSPAPGEPGCDDDCLNRVMQYECDNTNCALDADLCSNRPFAELAARNKKGGLYDIGVEVVKTESRGHGIRASRSFLPGQIIMEYTGEIITEEECQRRMKEVYKGKNNYYLMEMERNLVLDGTKGSMARFINHSCDPNCEVRMMKVNGVPRLGVYAGNGGIMTGEELSYDYNFDNFGDTRQPCYCGATNCRGYLGKRLRADELKKLQKEEAERRKREAEAAAKAAQQALRKKEEKEGRGSGWRGWLAIDDPEVKARLKAERTAREESAKHSARAQRLAKRAGGASADTESPKPESPARTKPEAKRRKTVSHTKEISRQVTSEVVEEESDEDIKLDVAKQLSRPKHRRTTSTGSKFTENLAMEEFPARRASARPASRSSTSNGITKKTTVSVTRKSTETHRETITEDAVSSARPSFADEITNAGRASPRKVSSQSNILADEQTFAVEQIKRSSSIKDRVKQAAKSAGKTFRQSTLNFAKLG